MTRKVSLWIVIALVAALAASLAAVVVLADDEGRGAPAARGPAGEAWHQAWGDGREAPAPPMMGSFGGWEREGEAPILPWVLFAVATGTAVGLLVAWSPWRTQPVAAAEEAGVGTAVADGPAFEVKCRMEEAGRPDAVADAAAGDDTATRQTPPTA